MSERNPQLDESRDEAARALFNPSHVMLYALSHSLSPHTVRTRLLDHIAGAPPVPRPKSPVDPFRNSSMPSSSSSAMPASSSGHHGGSGSVNTSTGPGGAGAAVGTGVGTTAAAALQQVTAAMGAGVATTITPVVPPMTAPTTTTHRNYDVNNPPRLSHDTPDPIVAYVRMPRSYRRRWNRH